MSDDEGDYGNDMNDDYEDEVEEDIDDILAVCRRDRIH
jgi:hypothetical protein